MRDAIRGLRTLFSSKGVKLVPLNEMVDAITVRRQAKKDIGACGGVLVGGMREEGGMLGVKMVVAITEGEDQSEERGNRTGRLSHMGTGTACILFMLSTSSLPLAA